jgi:cytochrome P450 family 135
MDRTGEVPPGPDAHYSRQALEWIRRPVAFLERNRAEFGPIFTARFGPRQYAVFVSDLDAVRRILATDGEGVRMGDANGLFRPAVGSSSILLLDGEEHLRHRRLMASRFSRTHVARFSAALERAVAERLARWPRGEPIALQPELEDIAFTTILAVVFGDVHGERVSRIRALFPGFMEACDRPVQLLPWFRRELGGLSPWGRLMRMVDEIDGLIREEIRARRDARDLERRPDLLSRLLGPDQDDGTPMTETEIRDELMTMLMAGQETTSAALAWAFERLAHNPKVAARLDDELAGGGGEEEYLDAVIRETLRLRPPIPIMARMVREPLALGEWFVPPGWVVMPCIYLLHREPAVYKRPVDFVPERFLVAPPPRGAWLPFGGGIRHCLGTHLAELEMKIVLRTVLSEVAVSPAHASEAIRRRRFAFSPAGDATVVLADRERRRQPAAEPSVAEAA